MDPAEHVDDALVTPPIYSIHPPLNNCWYVVLLPVYSVEENKKSK
jgi:hypothetical protein